jgi:hypothetical protein
MSNHSHEIRDQRAKQEVHTGCEKLCAESPSLPVTGVNAPANHNTLQGETPCETLA